MQYKSVWLIYSYSANLSVIKEYFDKNKFIQYTVQFIFT